ncbi:MAG: prephenate dehydratase [Gammaproteobacteria bacterium]|nr:MAG: prephenate dehydratase [Gammaproteobacteria bacterium]
MNDKLQSLRVRIDELDEKIQTLLNERARYALEIARLKNGAQPYRPEREAEVLRQALKRNQGPLSGEHITRIFREIMSACRAMEQTTRVAYLGPEGTFTQNAALKHFGHAIETRALSSIEEVFREVEADAAAYGVAPVENSTEGVVDHTLDMFMHSSLQICGEVELRIHQQLMGKMAALGEVRRIYAHPQSLGQCHQWLEAHLPGIERLSVSSNAEGARRATAEPGAAAIAGEQAAQIYQLNIIAANIEDNPDNTTRFLVVGKQAVPPSGQDKTSLLLATSNRPGALHRLLQPFARHAISLTRIESRPSRQGLWNYVFFVDIEGHAQDAKVTQALSELEADGVLVKILGAYPRAVL